MLLSTYPGHVVVSFTSARSLTLSTRVRFFLLIHSHSTHAPARRRYVRVHFFARSLVLLGEATVGTATRLSRSLRILHLPKRRRNTRLPAPRTRHVFVQGWFFLTNFHSAPRRSTRIVHCGLSFRATPPLSVLGRLSQLSLSTSISICNTVYIRFLC